MRFVLGSQRELDVARRAGAASASVRPRPTARSLRQTLAGRDPETARHLHRTGAEAGLLGRRLGLEQGRVENLRHAAALHDIGKIEVSERILNKPAALDPTEREALERHTLIGHRLLLAGAGAPLRLAATIALTHHERFDGSGYPGGLAGTDIPLPGRMAAIIDTYHAMSSPRPYRPAVSQHLALRQLYSGRDTAFQGELVEQFQACLGVYPTGSLVELNTGEVAVVMVQNQARRLQPRVAVLTRADKGPREDFLIVDLMNQADAVRREILRTLPAGSHGIDPREFFIQ